MSKKLIISATGFPETTKTWVFTQQILKDNILALTKAIGTTIILDGVEVDQDNMVSAGFILHNGEIYSFEAGLFNETVTITETIEEVEYNTDANNDTVLDLLPAYSIRTAICGAGLPNAIETFDFADLVRVKTLKELSELEKATQIEVNAAESTKYVTGETMAGRTATQSRVGVLALASIAEIIEGTNNTKAITPSALKSAEIVPIKITKGAVITSNRSQGQLHSNFTFNYAYVYPPTGYTMANLKGFIPSINTIFYGGDVNNNDTIWCNYQVQSSRIVVICQNSENRGISKVNYLAIWQK